MSLLRWHKVFEDFANLEQLGKCANQNLSFLQVLGTDDDNAIRDAILSECVRCKHHLLGLENFKKNICDKIKILNFSSS